MGPALPDPIWARATPASAPTTDPAGTPVATALITGEKAKELAIQYTEKYLKGFTVRSLGGAGTGKALRIGECPM